MYYIYLSGIGGSCNTKCGGNELYWYWESNQFVGRKGTISHHFIIKQFSAATRLTFDVLLNLFIFFVILHSQARKNELAVEDMDGGTFTISNGGVFGSLFGTPIINPPQSAILGMHGIFDRPVAVGGKVGI